MATAKRFWQEPQNVIALGVTIVSLCALVVSIQQTRIMQEERELIHQQAKAEVWPRLEFGITKGHNSVDGSIAKLEVHIANAGIGPAIVKGVEVRFGGKTVGDWWDLFNHFDLPDSVDTYIANDIVNQRIIRAGEQVTMLKLDDNLPLAQYFFENLAEVELVLWYESIYGDCWRLDLLNDGIKTVEVTPADIPAEEKQFAG